MSDNIEPFVYRWGVEVPQDVIFVVVHHSVKVLPCLVFFLRRRLKEVQLPEGLEEIRAEAFSGCESLERINCPSTIFKIGFSAFYGCRLLKEVQLPEGLEEIGADAFLECESLERINFPSTLVYIGDDAFHNCHSLKKVQLPEGFEQIGADAFLRCISLERINFPSTLVDIGHGAFEDCSSLKELSLPEGLEEIGELAFACCISLERINCPSPRIRISDCAFNRCTSLRKVTLMGEIVTIGGNIFDDCPSLERVTIPPNAFVVELEVDSDENSDSGTDSDLGVFTCRLVNQSFAITNAKQVIISPERLNYINSPDLLEIENAINTIMNGNDLTREENTERVLALIKSCALFEISTMLELALWKNEMAKINGSNSGSRTECRIVCRAGEIIPGVLSYL